MTTEWWRPDLNTNGLSQGDVIKPLPVAVSVVPPKRLQPGTGRGATEIWTPTEETKRSHFLFQGREVPVLVVSHDCDLDKNERKRRVLVAAMASLDTLPRDALEAVLGQERVSLVPLPDVPGLGGHYADLRLITTAPRELLGDDRRIASMSDEGVLRLQVQLAQFFIRLSPGAVETLLKGAAAVALD